jgi:hypothetical protein
VIAVAVVGLMMLWADELAVWRDGHRRLFDAVRRDRYRSEIRASLLSGARSHDRSTAFLYFALQPQMFCWRDLWLFHHQLGERPRYSLSAGPSGRSRSEVAIHAIGYMACLREPRFSTFGLPPAVVARTHAPTICGDAACIGLTHDSYAKI